MLIVGLVALSIGFRWSFFTGLAFVMGSAWLQGERPRSLVGWITRIVFFAGCIAVSVWFSSFGAEKLPLTGLVAIWLGCSLGEFSDGGRIGSWRNL